MLPVEWVAGFVEGEGTFSGSQRPYNYYQPQFAVYQKDRVILEQIQEFFEANGIAGSRIYENHPGLHMLSISGKARCRMVYVLLRPHMHAPVKIAQAETWWSKIQPNPRTEHHGRPKYGKAAVTT